MRKFLLGLTVLAGVAASASITNAAPRFGSPIPFASEAPVQLVHDGDDWRAREWRRHEEFERYRRHREWRHERFEEHEHDRRGW